MKSLQLIYGIAILAVSGSNTSFAGPVDNGDLGNDWVYIGSHSYCPDVEIYDGYTERSNPNYCPLPSEPAENLEAACEHEISLGISLARFESPEEVSKDGYVDPNPQHYKCGNAYNTPEEYDGGIRYLQRLEGHFSVYRTVKNRGR